MPEAVLELLRSWSCRNIISSPCVSGSHHSGPRIEGISYIPASSRHILSVESYLNALIRVWIIQTKENLLASGTASSGLRMADARPLFCRRRRCLGHSFHSHILGLQNGFTVLRNQFINELIFLCFWEVLLRAEMSR